MAEGLTKHGLFIDYLYRLRVLDPSVKSESSELNEKCTEYTEKLQDLRKIVDQFIEIAGKIVGDVEQAKTAAIAAQNQLKSMAKQRDVQQQDIQNEIFEKTLELEQLKVRLQYLQRIETNELETIENLHDNQ